MKVYYVEFSCTGFNDLIGIFTDVDKANKAAKRFADGNFYDPIELIKENGIAVYNEYDFPDKSIRAYECTLNEPVNRLPF